MHAGSGHRGGPPGGSDYHGSLRVHLRKRAPPGHTAGSGQEVGSGHQQWILQEFGQHRRRRQEQRQRERQDERFDQPGEAEGHPDHQGGHPHGRRNHDPHHQRHQDRDRYDRRPDDGPWPVVPDERRQCRRGDGPGPPQLRGALRPVEEALDRHRRGGESHQPPPRQADTPIAEPTATIPADDDVMAASNARRALNPDMPRVAWLRTQLNQMEARQRERLLKVVQLTLIAIVFITFVLQNAQGVNVHFLFFSLNIRLIWVIFGCACLGGFAGYLVGRPDKSLRALLPQKEKPAPATGAPPAAEPRPPEALGLSHPTASKSGTGSVGRSPARTSASQAMASCTLS